MRDQIKQTFNAKIRQASQLLLEVMSNLAYAAA